MTLPKVLIVNDDIHSAVTFRGVLAEGIERKEYEVVLAYSGEEALRHLLKDEFAVVLLDIKMPIMDGFETAEAIHSNLRLASLPIIFVTAYYDDHFHRLQGYQMGAVDYVFMPVNPKILKTKVSVFVEMARQKQALQNRNEELHIINDNLRIQRLYDLARDVNLLADETTGAGTLASPEERAPIYDFVTGLLNRPFLMDHLEYAVNYASRCQECFALLILDIDMPDPPGTIFQQTAKNTLLIKLADSIKLAVRISDLIARVDESRFAVLLKGVAGFQEAAQVAGKIALDISQGYDIDNRTVEIDLNIGLAMYPKEGLTPEELMAAADAALHPGKQLIAG